MNNTASVTTLLRNLHIITRRWCQSS